MALINYEHDMQRCSRCSYCKWIAFENCRDAGFMKGCPSVARYHWHSHSAGGKFNMAYSLLHGRIDYSDAFLDALYRCNMDGNCDVSCKAVQDIEPLQLMQELRIKCVEDGQVLPQHTVVIDGLRKENNMMQSPKGDRGNWAKGLVVKDLAREKAKVAYHAGCRYAFDEDLWPVARAGLTLLIDAGTDIGIMGVQESCCGGRAYEMGYASELDRFAKLQAHTLKKAGVETLVTPCSDCYAAFRVLYHKIGKKLGIEVLHISEYLDRLRQEGRLKWKNEMPMRVTYHDPCHLGRLAEPWVDWQGKEVKVMGQVIVHDPPKKFRRGSGGVYDIPRNIINNLPGLSLVEMHRIRESAWCCGAGGGVMEAYPDFSIWTATERLREAKSVGAEAIVTACPWCKRNFLNAAKETREEIEIYDLIELVQKAIQ